MNPNLSCTSPVSLYSEPNTKTQNTVKSRIHSQLHQILNTHITDIHFHKISVHLFSLKEKYINKFEQNDWYTSSTNTCTWEEVHSSKWVGDTTSNWRLMTLRYIIFWIEGQRPCSSGMTWGHPYAIYIFSSFGFFFFKICFRLVKSITDLETGESDWKM